MTDEPKPVRVIVTYSGPNTTDGLVSTEGLVTVGQLALAAWLLERQAADMRQVVMAAEAQRRAEVQAVANSFHNGRPR